MNSSLKLGWDEQSSGGFTQQNLVYRDVNAQYVPIDLTAEHLDFVCMN